MNWISSELKTFVYQRTFKKVKTQLIEWKKIFKNHISVEGLISKYIRTITQ